MSSNTHGGNIYKLAKEMNIDPLEVIDFSANINPLGLNKQGEKAILASLPECCHYPDPNSKELITQISSTYNVPEENIIVGNGAAELLFALSRIKGIKQVLIPEPGFSEYKDAAKAANLPIVSYNLKRKNGEYYKFVIPYEELTSIISQAKGQKILLFFGNPNNPDGTLLEKTKFLAFLNNIKDLNVLVVVDESFIDFTDHNTSMRNLVKEYNFLFVLHSLTKFLAVPGLRIGSLYIPKKYREELLTYIPTWSVNRMAQVYTVAALQDREYRKETFSLLKKEQAFFVYELKKYKFLEVVIPSVNFILIRWKLDSRLLEIFADFLYNKMMLIRLCTSYPSLGKVWFRIAIKSHKDNQLFIKYLEEFANEQNLLG